MVNDKEEPVQWCNDIIGHGNLYGDLTICRVCGGKLEVVDDDE